MENEKIKKIVKESYAKIASRSDEGCCSSNSSCCGSLSSNKEISKSIGYSDEEVDSFSNANLGLGCGNPTAFSGIK